MREYRQIQADKARVATAAARAEADTDTVAARATSPPTAHEGDSDVSDEDEEALDELAAEGRMMDTSILDADVLGGAVESTAPLAKGRPPRRDGRRGL